MDFTDYLKFFVFLFIIVVAPLLCVDFGVVCIFCFVDIL